MRPQRSSQGFTLVELLVVIAIIGVLAGLIAAAIPRVMEKARITNAQNNFNQIRTILIEYYTKHDSFPPSYGYITNRLAGDNRVHPDLVFDELNGIDSIPNLDGPQDVMFLTPWDALAGIHSNEDLRDTFSLGYDTNNDGTINRLEFAPIGRYIQSRDIYQFDYDELYLGDNGAGVGGNTLTDVQEQISTDDRRPYVYIAVNERQFRIFRKIIEDEADSEGVTSDPRVFNLSPSSIQQINDRLFFPPPSYDKFVLVSVGPNGAIGTAGLLPEFGVNGFMSLSDIPYAYQYHILGLAAYYMLTRDAENGGEGDQELDFDYLARTTRGQGRNADNDLPGQYPKGAGPLIYTGGS